MLEKACGVHIRINPVGSGAASWGAGSTLSSEGCAVCLLEVAVSWEGKFEP